MTKDRLYLLPPVFPDPNLAADRAWFCPHCALIEGALLANPHWRHFVEIRYIAFPRPRAEIVALVGEGKQGLPLLILGPSGVEPEGVESVNALRIVQGGSAIATALALRHGGVAPHP
jgi:hypothetical protein